MSPHLAAYVASWTIAVVSAAASLFPVACLAALACLVIFTHAHYRSPG